jgi:enoyl-CoA hydratase
MAAPTDPVSITFDDAVAVIRLDDGKANALGHAALDALSDALDQAEARARAVVLLGREGRFSAGFDLSVMTAGSDQMLPLLAKGAELTFRLLSFPLPTVAACTGHALAMGAIVLMATDLRVGLDGPYKIGMNEVRIGMPVPKFAVELGRDRLSSTHLVRALQLATVFDPRGAVDAGYLDVVVDGPEELERVALEQAADFASSLRAGAFSLTRTIMRAPLVESMRAALAWDQTTFSVEPG